MRPDPDAGEWRQVAADLGALAGEHVARAFAWIDAELAGTGGEGAVVLMLALHDLDRGIPLRAVLADVLLAADDAERGRDVADAVWSGAR